MLWLCLAFPQLPAEAQGLRDPLDVVTDSRSAQRWLITPHEGCAPGMALADALALRPALRAHPRKLNAERALLKSLAHWIYRYGSPVHLQIDDPGEPGRAPRYLLWVEIGASERLFGGLDALLAAIRSDLAELQPVARLAIAPTRGGAALLTLEDDPAPVYGLDALETRLGALPSAWLPWPQAQLDALHGVGLRRIGDLFALPRAAFARRFGVERLRALDRLRGLQPDPASAIVPPPVFRRRFELPGNIESTESLLFPLRRLTQELQAWLRSRDVGVRSIELQFEHANRQRSVMRLRFLSAHRDGQRIFTALRERLERQAPATAVRALLLKAEDLATAALGQGNLFDAATDTQQQWTETVERLLARLGVSALWSPVLHEDHRPERAMARATPGASGRTPTAVAQRRPLWLLPTPVPLPRAPQVAGEPERIEAGWWDAGDLRRDYYTAEMGADMGSEVGAIGHDARAWVFRDHIDQRWYLHGWWA